MTLAPSVRVIASVRVMAWAGALLALAAPIACAPRRRAEPVTAPSSPTTGGGVMIVEATASTYVEPTSTGGGGSCAVTLAVYDVRTRPGCVVDARVTAAPATLYYPCGGGVGTVSFDGTVFEGAVSPAGEVDLSLRTGFDFTDGCHWETKQYLRGNLSTGALAYEYREEPDPGQAGCAAACLATASVRVAR